MFKTFWKIIDKCFLIGVVALSPIVASADYEVTAYHQDMGKIGLPATFYGSVSAIDSQLGLGSFSFVPKATTTLKVKFSFRKAYGDNLRCKCELSSPGTLATKLVTEDGINVKFVKGERYSFLMQGASGANSGTGHLEGIADDLAMGTYHFTVVVGVTLTGVRISGADTVIGGKTSSYACQADYSDGTSSGIKPTWSISSGSGHASISSTGVLTAKAVSAPQNVTVKAEYKENGVTKTATRNVLINPLRPDLAPAEVSGWGSPLIVSTSSAATSGLTSFLDVDSLYVRYAVKCTEKAAETFQTALYVDDVFLTSFTTVSLGVDSVASNASGYPLGRLPVGTHTVKMVVDSGSSVAEVNEDNNTYSRTITVAKSCTLTYSPGTWGLESPQTLIKRQSERFSLDGARFTCSGYVQDGWSKDPEGTTKDYSLNATFTISENTILYPYWKVGDDFVMSYGEIHAYTGPGGVVRIPVGVTSIDTSPYGNWRNVTELIIPPSVTNIGNYAFSTCNKLKSLVLSGKSITLKDDAFYDCDGLTQLEINADRVKICTGAFNNCENLKSVRIQADEVVIGSVAFADCLSLCSLEIQAVKLTFDTSSFADCRGLADDDGLLIVKGVVCQYFGAASVLEIPKGVTRIGSYAFTRCASLSSIRIPKGVTNVERNAFYDCTSLASVFIPSSVSCIGQNAFEGCKSLRMVYVDKNDEERMRGMMLASGCDVARLTFVPTVTYAIRYDPGSYGVGVQVTEEKVIGYDLTLQGALYTRKGYDQTGWWVKDATATQYALGASYAKDEPTTFYPTWTPHTYSIAYDLQGGDFGVSHSESATYNVAFPVSAPVRAGYAFTGWTVTGGLDTSVAVWGMVSMPSVPIGGVTALCANGANGTVYFKNITAVKNGRVTLTANWTPNEYAIAYELNGGSFEQVPVAAKTGGTAPLVKIVNPLLFDKNPTRMPFDQVFYVTAPYHSEYLFAGWTVTDGLDASTAKWGPGSNSLSPIGDSSTRCANGPTGNVYFRNLTAMTDGHVTLTANWMPRPATYAVIYDPGVSGIGAPVTEEKTQGLALTLRGVTFMRTGYTQNGWSRSPDGTTRDYGLGASYKTDAAVTLYPYWTAEVKGSPSYGAGKVSQFDLPAELGGGFARVVGVDNLAAGAFAKVLYRGNTWDMNGKPPAVDHYYWCFTGSANLIDVEKDSTFGNQDDFWCYDLTDLNLAYFGGWIPKGKYATVDAVANAFRKAKNAETFKWLDGKLSSFGLADKGSVSDYVVDFDGIPYEAEFHGFLEEQFNGGKRLVHLGVSGHDVTCCGYSTGTDDRLNGLFVIDSDNDMFNGGGAEKAPNRIMFCPLRGNVSAVDFDWLKDGELLIANIFAEDWAPIDYAYALKHVTEPKEPKVVFDGVGAPVSPSEKAIIPGAPFGELPTPERIGYSFAGWQNDTYGSVTADTVVRYDEVVVLHAIWEAHHYTVRFHSNEGGDETYEQHLTYDMAQELTPNAFVNGELYFAGWATLPEGPAVYADHRRVANLTAEDGAVIDLYAVWSEKPPISWTEAQLFYGTYADTKGKPGAVTLTTAKGTEKDGVVSATFTAKVKINGKTYSYKGGKVVDGEVTKLPTSSTKGAPKFSALELSGLGIVGTVGGYVLDGERIEKPVLAIGESRNAMVGVRYERTVAVENPFGGIKYSASGLPAGLKINASTGVISGVPTKAKTYSKVKITATSKVSSSCKTSQVLTIAIAALPSWARGTFNGEVSVDGVPGSATISVGSTGKVTAKFSAGGTNWTSTATGYSASSDAANGQFEFAGTVKAKISKKLTLSAPLTFGFAGPPASGPAATCLGGSWTGESETVPSATFTAFRNAWKDSGASACLNGWTGAYTWCDAEGGKLKLTLGSSGTVKVAGTLSNGRKISLSAPLLYDREDVVGVRKLLLHAGAATAKVKGRKVAYPEFHALLYLVDKYQTPDVGSDIAYRDPGVKASVDDTSTGNGSLSYSTSYGQAASNKTVKVTAKAKSGSVFAYWLKDGEIVGYGSSYGVKMVGEDVTGLTAVFRLKSDFTEEMLGLPVVGLDSVEGFEASGDFGHLSVGVQFRAQAKVDESFYPVKFTARGLPKGLSINATTGVISGVPTATCAGREIVITAACAANADLKGSVTLENVTVLPLPKWARGTVRGRLGFTAGPLAGKSGSCTVTVGSSGKVAGAVKVGSKAHSFSAPGYVMFDEYGYNLYNCTMTVGSSKYEVFFDACPNGGESDAAYSLSFRFGEDWTGTELSK